MEHARIDISQDLDGNPVVYACFDLAPEQIAAAAHAVAATAGERFRVTEMSADDVLELRELTTLLDALSAFVESREQAEWVREEDRKPLALGRELLYPLEQLSAEATRTA